MSCPIIWREGLTENVLEAINIVRPWSVDVSTGVDKSPGKKDVGLIADFIMEVNSLIISAKKMNNDVRASEFSSMPDEKSLQVSLKVCFQT